MYYVNEMGLECFFKLQTEFSACKDRRQKKKRLSEIYCLFQHVSLAEDSFFLLFHTDLWGDKEGGGKTYFNI